MTSAVMMMMMMIKERKTNIYIYIYIEAEEEEEEEVTFPKKLQEVEACSVVLWIIYTPMSKLGPKLSV